MDMVRGDAYRMTGNTGQAEADEARADAMNPVIRERWNQPVDGDE